MPKKITQDDFIKSVKLIHGENIDFSNAVYIKDNIGVVLMKIMLHLKTAINC